MNNIRHIDIAIVPQTNPRMYLIHKFWARKPANVIREYIKTYSKKGNVVFDPFCGSGTTIGEAIKLGRKAIGIDLSPIATIITNAVVKSVDLDKLQQLFLKLKQEVGNEINEFYSTVCSVCGKKVIAKGCIRENPKLEYSKLSSIWYICSYCKKTLSKKPTKSDNHKLKTLEKQKILFWYPTDRFPSGQIFEQAKREAGKTYNKLFTKRNLHALAKLYDRIERFPNSPEKEQLKVIFSSSLIQVSKLIPINENREKAGIIPAATWSIQSFWCPPRFFEGNVLFYFETRFNKMKKAKAESNKILGREIRQAKKFSDLEKKGFHYLLLTQSVIDLSSKQIPSNSIDYVFTDPPYGSAIHYLELSAFFYAWLNTNKKRVNFDLSFRDEIILRNTNYGYYQKQLIAAFREVYRVLKPGRWLTLTFHSTKIKIFTTIIRAVIYAGFKLEKILYQPPAKKSVAGLNRPFGSAHGDYYIRFRKPLRKKVGEEKRLTEAQFENIVVETAKGILAQRGQSTYYTHMLNGIYVELDKNNALLHSGEQEVETILKRHIGKEFITIDVLDEKSKKRGVKWWFKDPKTVPYIEKIPLSDRVEKAVLSVLERIIKVEFTDVQQEVLLNFPNALTPDSEDIIEFLEEYSEKTKDGKWRLKPIVKLREREHSQMIYYLMWIGSRLGYKVYSGHPKSSLEGRKASELKNFITIGKKMGEISGDRLKRVKKIDVVWIKDSLINSVFEVENTTGITDSLVRVSNIPYSTNNHIVIPEEREKLLIRKIKEPLFGQYFKKGNWKIIFYGKLEETFRKSKRKRKLRRDMIKEIVGVRGKELDVSGQKRLF